MRKLDLILESIRDEYMINLLEEGEVSELETLKTKKFLNENLNRIRGMLVEEGALDSVKNHLANNWGKYLAGAGALGAGALGHEIYQTAQIPGVDYGEAAQSVGHQLTGGLIPAPEAGDFEANTASVANGQTYGMAPNDAMLAANAAGEIPDEKIQDLAKRFQSGELNKDDYYSAVQMLQQDKETAAAPAAAEAARNAYAERLNVPTSAADVENSRGYEAIGSAAKGEEGGLTPAQMAGLGVAGAAGLGAAGYGAKKAYDKYKK